MTDKEIEQLAEQSSIKYLGRISPAYIDGYIQGWRDEAKHH